MRTTSVDLEERQREITKSMAENGDAANQSEAIRDAIEHYAQETGYKNGTKRDTVLRQTTRRFADALALMALLWVGLTWLHPVGFRIFALPMFVGAISLYVMDRALAKWEPSVSRRIRGAFVRGEKA